MVQASTSHDPLCLPLACAPSAQRERTSLYDVRCHTEERWPGQCSSHAITCLASQDLESIDLRVVLDRRELDGDRPATLRCHRECFNHQYVRPSSCRNNVKITQHGSAIDRHIKNALPSFRPVRLSKMQAHRVSVPRRQVGNDIAKVVTVTIGQVHALRSRVAHATGTYRRGNIRCCSTYKVCISDVGTNAGSSRINLHAASTRGFRRRCGYDGYRRRSCPGWRDPSLRDACGRWSNIRTGRRLQRYLRCRSRQRNGRRYVHRIGRSGSHFLCASTLTEEVKRQK